MAKIRLFYSYSHKDEQYREALEKNLAVLREDQLIDEWHDRKIDAGDCWNDAIDENMENAHIILLLLSTDFISSNSCRKELNEALRLKKEKHAKIIPIILRTCSWKDLPEIASIQALPRDGQPISTWPDQDEAWLNVYEAIKIKIKKILEEKVPRIKDTFKNSLLKEAANGHTLDKLFTYPDISEVDVDVRNELANNKRIDSKALQDLKNLDWKYLLIEGEEQSGKTALCHMLYLYYAANGLYPILLNGKDIIGKADLKVLVDNQYNDQYEIGKDYWSLDNEKIILLIDDIDEKHVKDDIFSNFILSIRVNFKYAIIFIDELQSLSERSSELNHFSYLHNFAISPLGHKKRSELIKKCISSEEQTVFDEHNNEHLARLDRNTQHINTIIGSNIVPSYPIFIITIFHTIEVYGSTDLTNTSYGHCYHAMITMNLGRVGIKAQDIDSYFNLLTQLAYFMFNRNSKSISGDELA
ncbi:MAG: toll/interleukin-1 receptor domain-containing protein, partial [Ignavibacteriaceae bacterium]|nr:toll/interleukin-1 receptor domain-containing protein [Ignavibacteriaceae bacterium]